SPARSPLLAFGLPDPEGITARVAQQLSELHRVVSEGGVRPTQAAQLSVMLLGRYRDDEPPELAMWQRRYADRLTIQFRTVHAAKGLEADYVFLLHCVQGARGFPSQIEDDPTLRMAMPAPEDYPFAEERRLFYVALTRARRQVRIFTLLDQPSQFLVELVRRGHLRIEPLEGEPPQACPQCGRGVLRLRLGPYSGFYGCSRYPACDHRSSANVGMVREEHSAGPKPRMPVSTRVGEPCPICRLGLVQEKHGRNGRFLACSRSREGCRATGNVVGGAE
ncbi:MAG: hypothetical protein RL026_574, partial [Pseudomonadota bacterium]